ncbi:chromosome segregation protein, partial [Escherichia coli]|nr:chromosome segregation protein [Escherichia coli]
MVEAPDALARRLAQIFVAETDDGQPLAVGQRLVTLAGVLRRWDGYVAKSGGAAAAERLERVNRLRALDKMRPALVRGVDSADADLARIDGDISEARRAAADCRRLLDASESLSRDAARAEDRAAAALERLDAQAQDLAQRATRAAVDR